MKFIAQISIAICSFLVSSSLFAQANVYFGQKNLVFPQKAGAYKTLEDFLADSLTELGTFNKVRDTYKTGIQFARHLDEINFGDEFYKPADFPYFGYKDYYGNRHRVIGKHDFIVLCAGAKWLYTTGYGNNTVEDGKKKKPIYKYGRYPDITLRYGNGVSDTDVKWIKKWNKKYSTEASEKLFADDAETAKAYEEDKTKPKVYDPAFDNPITANMERIVFFLDQYNKKRKDK